VVQAESAISRTATARCGCLIANFMLPLKTCSVSKTLVKKGAGGGSPPAPVPTPDAKAAGGGPWLRSHRGNSRAWGRTWMAERRK